MLSLHIHFLAYHKKQLIPFISRSMTDHYIAVALVQPNLMGDYQDDAIRVMLTSNDKAYSRSNVDAFEFLFSDRRGRDARQLWHMGDNANADTSNGEKEQRFCFRKVRRNDSRNSFCQYILL